MVVTYVQENDTEFLLYLQHPLFEYVQDKLGNTTPVLEMEYEDGVIMLYEDNTSMVYEG